MDDRARRIQAVIAAIPPGQVLSYGEVAVLAGVGSPRLVGRILAEATGSNFVGTNVDKLPSVVRAFTGYF